MMRALALLLTSALVSCVPLKQRVWLDAPIAQAQLRDDSERKLKPGDVIYAHTKQGKTHLFRVNAIESESFVGIARDKKKYRMYFKDLSAIEVRRKEWTFALAVPRIWGGW